MTTATAFEAAALFPVIVSLAVSTGASASALGAFSSPMTCLVALEALVRWAGPALALTIPVTSITSSRCCLCKFAGDLLSTETEPVHLLHGSLSICSFVVFDEGVSHLEREVSDLAEALELIFEIVLVNSTCELANVDRATD